MNNIQHKKQYTSKEKIKIFLKPIKSILFPKKIITHDSEEGSITLESALVMPVIALAICLILFSINIGINYMKIQDIAQSCSHIIQVNNDYNECYNMRSIKENSNTKITINEKNKHIEIKVEKDISFFPNITPIKLKTQSITYK